MELAGEIGRTRRWAAFPSRWNRRHGTPAVRAGGAAARRRHAGKVSPVRAKPHATVSAIARLLTAAGERLLPGDPILAGSACRVRVKPGDDIVAAIDGLGAVAATRRSGPAEPRWLGVS